MKKWINSKKNTLLHVDEHLDMGAPRLKTSIFNVDDNINALIDLTYNELPINAFIIPAIFQGLIDKVCWIKTKHNRNIIQRRKRCVRTFNNEGKKFLIFNPDNKPSNTNMKMQKFSIIPSTMSDVVLTNHQDIILDINLNYFSSIYEPGEYRVNYIEITEKEYTEFKENYKYHNLRYELLGHRIEAVEEKGKYYYAINDHEEVYALKNKRKEEEIIKTINSFINSIQTLNFSPKIISITRSAKSGYTPEDQVEFIENTLIAKLNAIYNLNIFHIEDLISGFDKVKKVEKVETELSEVN